MERMRSSIAEDRNQIREGIKHAKNLAFYDGIGRFVKDYTIEVDGKKIMGEKIFIAAGARPFIPNVKGLETVDYLTNETILELDELPKSLAILGEGILHANFLIFWLQWGAR